MSASTRLVALCLVPIVYVAIAAMRAAGPSAATLFALLGLPALVVAAFRATEPRTVGEDLVGAGPRAAFRIAVVGAGLYAAARTGGVGRTAFDAAAALGAGLAITAALAGLASVPAGPGLLKPSAASRRLDATFAMVLVGAIATTLPAVAVISPQRGAAIDPLTIDYALVAEGAGGLGLLTVAAGRFRVLRRLELGVADRATAALTIAATALGVAVPAAFLGFSAPDRLLPAAGVLASIGVTIALALPDAAAVGRGLRTLLLVSLVGTPIALGAAGVAAAAPKQAGGVVLGASVLLVLIGVLGHRFAARMRPESARWLGALEHAEASVSIPEPTSALSATLGALREHLGPSAPSPALFRIEEGDQLTVDRAGYLHEGPGTPPPDLLALCEAEPHHTLRVEVARALEVRSANVRPVLAWMEAHDFATATSLSDDDGPVGFLVVPRAKRRSPLTLEEAIALGRLSQRVASVFALSSALARARSRQLAAEAGSEKSAEESSQLRLALEREGERYTAHARRAARGSPVGRYSPAGRIVEAELLAAAQADRPTVLLVPPGVDAVSFAATLHLASDRKTAPFVVVDGADRREHPAQSWSDPITSPFHLARAGTLLILDVVSLPTPVQDLLAHAIVDRSEDLRWVVTVRETVDALVARGRMGEKLADALGDRALPLPPLAARAEDLQAIALEHLARLGTALRGAPFGLADDALGVLLEHAWPGNDQELELVLLRAAQIATGRVVTRIHLAESGFASASPRSPG